MGICIYKQTCTHLYIVRHTWAIVGSAEREQAIGTEFYVCPLLICNSEKTI